jgi:hypothetical protein
LPEVDDRKGMPPVKPSRAEFEQRYRIRFAAPLFKPLQRELAAIVDAAWDAYANSRKAPVTRKAGPGFADPDYEISAEGRTYFAGIRRASWPSIWSLRLR